MSIANKLTVIAQNEKKIYDAGNAKGYEDGYSKGKVKGLEDGRKAEHDRFWDRWQSNGERTDYKMMNGTFNGKYFGFSNFYPKYDIKPEGDASFLFYAWENASGDSIGSLKQRLEECGVALDTSKATSLTNAFAYSRFTEIPIIDCTGLSGGSTNVFASAYGNLKSIEKIIVNETVTFTKWFNSTNPLEVRFEGTIGQDLDLSYQSYKASESRLSKASIENIVNCLSNTATGKILTLSKTAVDNADFGSSDVVYISAEPNSSTVILSEPIYLEAGQKLKVSFEVEKGHWILDDPQDGWLFGFMGIQESSPTVWSDIIFTVSNSGLINLYWYFDNPTNETLENIPIKIRAVLVDDDENEITGGNLHKVLEMLGEVSVSNGVVPITWDTLTASKPYWTFTLV